MVLQSFYTIMKPGYIKVLSMFSIQYIIRTDSYFPSGVKAKDFKRTTFPMISSSSLQCLGWHEFRISGQINCFYHDCKALCELFCQH